MSVRVRLTPTARADRLVAMWSHNDVTPSDTPIDLQAMIAAEIEAAERATNKALRTRNANLHAQLECAIAALREMQLKRAVRQSAVKDWYRNVAGRGVRLGLSVLRSIKEGRSTKI